MNYETRKLTFWMLVFCVLAAGIVPALAKAQASSSSSNSTSAKPPIQAPVASASPGSAAAPGTATKSAGATPSSSEISAAKASGKVWVNTESGVYHKSGRWYGKTKQGKFMTEAEAKAAGYKAAAKE
jgi:hypothetical protein